MRSKSGSVRARVLRIKPDRNDPELIWDRLTIEDPLEIRVGAGEGASKTVQSLGLTMRTPGHDEELAAGFLLSEQVISSVDDIEEIAREEPEDAGRSIDRIIRVDLKPTISVDLERVRRRGLINSSCGVCGTATLETLGLDRCRPLLDETKSRLETNLVFQLPEILTAQQSLFSETGGIHAAALVDLAGDVIMVREDIGRHNTVDKLIGARALALKESLDQERWCCGVVLVVSGRAGFDIVQKAVVARIPILAAIGAPSSLAVEVATTFGITLLGFVGPRRFNVYSAPWRLASTASSRSSQIQSDS